MNIIGISTVCNEAEIVTSTIEHLRRHGVDEFIVSYGPCTDDTIKILGALPDVTSMPSGEPFHQADEMTKLTRLAYEQHADWVIPFDADEFWQPDTGQAPTIRAVLAGLDPSIDTVYVPMFQHLDWERRVTYTKPLGKVCFRPRENSSLRWGNHDVSPTGEVVHGIINIRELQYRDRAHFDQKIARATRLHAEITLAEGDGTHMQELIDMTAEQRDKEWARISSQPTVIDPIR